MSCFQLYRDDRGNHYFRLHTLVGAVVLRSSPYADPRAAHADITAVRNGSGNAESYVRTQEGMGWSFCLRTSDRVLATGALYANAHDRETAIAHVMRTAPDADVFELTDEEAAPGHVRGDRPERSCGC